MEEPVLSDHSSSSSKKSKGSSSSSKQSSKSSKNSSPINLPSRDTPPDILQTDDNFALEILEDDLTCVICKGMDVGARNRLVECVECHSLYHQECHTPHIMDAEIDDPRLVWYCSSCSKSQQVCWSSTTSNLFFFLFSVNFFKFIIQFSYFLICVFSGIEREKFSKNYNWRKIQRPQKIVRFQWVFWSWNFWL